MTDSYPQPHEGITGTLRDGDDLLCLDDLALPVRAVIVALAVHLRTAVTVGHPAPIVARIWDRIHAPRPGDLVVEESTLYREPGRFDAFGIFLVRRQEWASTHAEWAAKVREGRRYHRDHLSHLGPFEPDERQTEHAWYIQYGPQPADIARWYNCSFLVIPTGLRDFERPVGTRTATGIVMTRDDLISAMADCGIELSGPTG